jgi:hypothetical protein
MLHYDIALVVHDRQGNTIGPQIVRIDRTGGVTHQHLVHHLSITKVELHVYICANKCCRTRGIESVIQVKPIKAEISTRDNPRCGKIPLSRCVHVVSFVV